MQTGSFQMRSPVLGRGLVPATAQAPLPHRHLLMGGAFIEQVGIAPASLQHLL